ncbi:ABC transporter permease [Lewinella sp. W8]|uniref:ABC transporter permease n=1 Tax=Lewinella sp. W8 TaxID=2528208 RepID=UPI0010684D3D|nr:ABC transporter permease [Lewinella sp. W8]MTB53651.1 FtsX-like permease family protein [Lewinella sp. W8]
MIKNYFLLALKVLKRKPFYTFVSLFGISFTLMILMVLTSLFDAILGNNKPLTDRDQLVIMPMIERTRTETDTILRIDTIAMQGGEMRYDTSYTYEDDIVSTSNGPIAYPFLEKHFTNLDGAVNYAFYNDNTHIDGYLEGRKFTLNSYYVTHTYWEIFDFNFRHGTEFYEADVESANQVVVITDKAAREYFGEVSEGVIGQEMVLGEKTFTVRGIVERPLSDSPMFAGDIYMPVTTTDPRELSSTEVYGGFGAVFLAKSPEGRQAIMDEINSFAENYQMPADSYHDAIEMFNSTFFEGYAMGLLGERDPKVATRTLFIPIIVLILLFVALPLINLVNLNNGRVQERRSEIGVRKAFGANSRDILLQFIFENLVLTAIGGVIGMALALGLISYVNQQDVLGITRLSSSPEVFLYFLLVVLMFGFLSGILPAYRMSRTNVANSLR